MTSATDFAHLDETVTATARLIESVEELTDAEAREASLLPDWSRGHVVAHLARNADALANLLRQAQAGQSASMYESQEQRDADIAAGADRSAAELLEDLVAACGRWEQAANELHSSRLDAPVRRTPDAPEWPVRKVGMMRRTEVEVHHADLGLGYTALEWPADFVEAMMGRRHRELSAAGVAVRWHATDTGADWATAEDAPQVTGLAADILWWLLGRGHGDGLECSTGTLPEIGRWR